ncbi:site-specific integrase [Vibrio sp. AND4]|uniref:site-specific integrase n=1 Tax=Vibrio sp. AND4 TaxID=314289 RepID=UPI00015F3045|nr:site-specific integrase [Vibrio sp. AND4]EDP60814.1 putative integrase [Vibrio sp. AND4]
MAPSQNVKLPAGVEIHGKSLRLDFVYKGKRRRETLGLSPTKQNVRFAAQKRETIMYEIKIGIFRYAAHFPDSPYATEQSQSRTFGEMVDKYLQLKQADLRSSTYKKYVSLFKITKNAYGANRSCSTLSPESVSELRALLIKGRGARTLNTYFRAINTFFGWLHKMGYVDRNFSEFMPSVKTPERNINPFTIDEINKALDACMQEQHKNMITLLAYTGLRTGEICGLAWEDVDFENKVLTIRRATFESRGLKTPKTDRERTVDLMPPALEALQAQKKLSSHYPQKEHEVELADKTIRLDNIRFVFNPKATENLNAKTPYDYFSKTAPNKMWRNICIRAGIPYRNVYQLRHTYASWMLSYANVNIAYLAQQMGHSNFLMIASVYGKWMKNKNASESEKAWEALKGVCSK